MTRSTSTRPNNVEITTLWQFYLILRAASDPFVAAASCNDNDIVFLNETGMPRWFKSDGGTVRFEPHSL